MTRHEHVPDDQRDRVDEICDRFQNAWNAGERPSIEAFLKATPELPSAVLLRELLATEMELLLRAGQPVPLQDYLVRFSYAGLVDAVYRQVVKDVTVPAATSSSEVRKLQHLRDYELLEKLGEGGFGSVFAAVHTKLGKRVAIKLLPPEMLSDPTRVTRFQREMKAIGALDHPNIVRATDAGEIDGCHYLVMELIDGPTFSTLVRRIGPLPIREACELIRQAAVALDAAHNHGLVHRDVKPSNLMLTHAMSQRTPSSGTRHRSDSSNATESLTKSDDLGYGSTSGTSDSWLKVPIVKLLDLGLARLQGQATELTAESQVIGTLDYMAPEQARKGGDVGPQADIYSLGCTLFTLLAGRAPFSDAEHASAAQKILAHVEEPLPPLAMIRPDVPPLLSDILKRMTAKKLEARFVSAAAVAEALAPLAAGANLSMIHAAPRTAEMSTAAGSLVDPTLAYAASDSVRVRRKTKVAVLAGAVVLLGLVVAISSFRGDRGWGRVFEPRAEGDRSTNDRGRATRPSPLDPGQPSTRSSRPVPRKLLTAPQPTKPSAGRFINSGQQLGQDSNLAVALGDLDGDGDLDAFVAGFKSPSRVLMNDGTGTLTDSGQELGNCLAYSVLLDDLDGDGDLDALVVSTNDESLSYSCRVWLNDGHGRFSDSGQEIAKGLAANDGVLGDIDGDGDLDLILSCWQQPTVLWRNNGDAKFSGPEQLDGRALHTGVALADLDGDGDLDLAVSLLQGGVKILRNDGRGKFEPDAISLDVDRATSVAFGDLDGFVDAFITTGREGDRVFLNDGRGDFRDSGQRLIARLSEAVALADLDGDGDLDAVTVSSDWASPQPRLVWHNDGRGQFGNNPVQFIVPGISLGLALGDLNGDGSLDIYFANHAKQPDEIWFNQSVKP